MAIFKCKMCGGTVDFNQGNEVAFCDSCGTKYNYSDYVIENDELKIQKLKHQEEQERLRLQAEIENKRLQYQIEKEKEAREKEELENFKKGIYKHYLLLSMGVSAAFAIFGFLCEKYKLAVILLIMSALFLTAFLMRMKIIPEGKKWVSVLLVVIAVLLSIPFICVLQADL